MTQFSAISNRYPTIFLQSKKIYVSEPWNLIDADVLQLPTWVMHYVRVTVDSWNNCLSIHNDLDGGLLFGIKTQLKSVNAAAYHPKTLFVFGVEEVLGKGVD